MPSDPPTPEQWNLQGGWLAAYQAAARRGSVPANATPLVQTSTPPKEEPMEDPMQGGWKHEGKEKPVTIRICTKCQGPKQYPPEEADKSTWCEDCLEGKLLGHAPTKNSAPRDKYDNKNAVFFGGT